MKLRLTMEFGTEHLAAINLYKAGEQGKATRETADAFVREATHGLLVQAVLAYRQARAQELREEADRLCAEATDG